MSSLKFACKETLRQVFIRVYTVSDVGIFDQAIAPLTFSLVHLPPVPPIPWVKVQYIRTVCGWGGGGGGGVWPDSESTKLLDHPQQKPRRGGCLRQINTCRKVPIQVNLFRWRHFALLYIGLIFLRYYSSDSIAFIASYCIVQRRIGLRVEMRRRRCENSQRRRLGAIWRKWGFLSFHCVNTELYRRAGVGGPNSPWVLYIHISCDSSVQLSIIKGIPTNFERAICDQKSQLGTTLSSVSRTLN